MDQCKPEVSYLNCYFLVFAFSIKKKKFLNALFQLNHPCMFFCSACANIYETLGILFPNVT